MEKKFTITIKANQTKAPNKMHLSAQQTYKAQVFKPKKGKGSYKRNKRVEGE